MPPTGASRVDGSASWLTALISGLVMGVPSGGDEGVLFTLVLSLYEKKKKKRKALLSSHLSRGFFLYFFE